MLQPEQISIAFEDGGIQTNIFCKASCLAGLPRNSSGRTLAVWNFVEDGGPATRVHAARWHIHHLFSIRFGRMGIIDFPMGSRGQRPGKLCLILVSVCSFSCWCLFPSFLFLPVHCLYIVPSCALSALLPTSPLASSLYASLGINRRSSHSTFFCSLPLCSVLRRRPSASSFATYCSSILNPRSNEVDFPTLRDTLWAMRALVVDDTHVEIAVEYACQVPLSFVFWELLRVPFPSFKISGDVDPP